MPESIESQFHVGLVLSSAYPQSQSSGASALDALLKIASDDFFGAVELSAIDDPGARREAHSLLEASHLDAILGAGDAIEQQGLNLNAEDERERERAVAVARS